MTKWLVTPAPRQTLDHLEDEVNDEFNIPITMPLDPDGFLRRECPSCEAEFKWFVHHEDDPDAEPVNHYFCPLCGQSASTDSWWTPEQLEYLDSAAAPAIDNVVNAALDDVFKGLSRNKAIKVKRTGSFNRGTPSVEPPVDPGDMVIVEPPCHPNEPLKVPETALTRVRCLVCGSPFAA